MRYLVLLIILGIILLAFLFYPRPASGDQQPPSALAIVKSIGYDPVTDGGLLTPVRQAPFTAELVALRAWQAANPPPPPPVVPVTPPEPVYVAPAPAPVVYTTQDENYYKQWIYNEESGNDPTRWNSSGCVGIGQACPASKLLAVCPNLDYACEDNFFTQYMLSRYGSWLNAYNAHLAQGWW